MEKVGVLQIYIKNNIAFQHRHDTENFLEYLWIEIFQKHSKSFLVGCYYRPPETSNYLPRNFNNLKQIIKQATRITHTSSTLIDLLMKNRPSNISLSNHDMIACNRKINANRFEPRIITCRNYANYNMDKMSEDRSKINW